MIICSDCGANSTEPDFCSDCGKAITPLTVVAQNANNPLVCPICGDKRESEAARFCASCCYDFVDAKVYTPPEPEELEIVETFTTLPSSPVSVMSNPPNGIEPISLDNYNKWELVCKVDASLVGPDDPKPTDFTERLFPILFEENLIGKRSESKGTHPEIRIDDPGISRRHALIKKDVNGSLFLLDLDSTNGTILNNKPITANVALTLKNGDVITIGCWTRLFVTGSN